MLAASTSDQELLARVLASAFENDPLLRWIIPDDRDYQFFAHRYFELQIRSAVRSGSSFTNDERTAVATWCRPDDQQPIFLSFLEGLKTIWLLKGNISRAFFINEVMARYRPKKQYLHLTLLATSPESQGGGRARQLIEPMLDEARELKLPVYLECSNKDNLGFYRQFGFRLIDDIPITTDGMAGPTIWPMTLEH